MRGYLPMTKSELADFCQGTHIHPSRIWLPTQALANDYGVSDLEDLEYGALEVARESAERDGQPFIVALEMDDEITNRGTEVAAGILEGQFSFAVSDAAAFYLILGTDDELEWYDSSEVALCLAKIEG